jgi:hypothetical protein
MTRQHQVGDTVRYAGHTWRIVMRYASVDAAFHAFAPDYALAREGEPIKWVYEADLAQETLPERPTGAEEATHA